MYSDTTFHSHDTIFDFPLIEVIYHGIRPTLIMNSNLVRSNHVLPL